MIEIECPWCATQVELTADGRVSCPDCAVTVELAPEGRTELPAAA